MSKVCTFKINDKESVGIFANGKIICLNGALRELGIDFQASTMIELLIAGDEGLHAVKAVENANLFNSANIYDKTQIVFSAPIPKPGKFLCLAGNYLDHLAEHRGITKISQVERPKDIHVFVKSNTSVIGPYDDIIVPQSVHKLDYEMELGFVIGKKGKYIPEDMASRHIAGYFVVNDVTDRDFMPEQKGGRIHWYAMKAKDRFAPFGPYILLKDSIDSISELEMEIYVNNELRQRVNPQNMVFKPEWIVSRISSWVTLEPGDIVITGTPAGDAWSSGKFLNDGDIIETRMKEVGVLRNKVVFEDEIYRFE